MSDGRLCSARHGDHLESPRALGACDSRDSEAGAASGQGLSTSSPRSQKPRSSEQGNLGVLTMLAEPSTFERPTDGIHLYPTHNLNPQAYSNRSNADVPLSPTIAHTTPEDLGARGTTMNVGSVPGRESITHP